MSCAKPRGEVLSSEHLQETMISKITGIIRRQHSYSSGFATITTARSANIGIKNRVHEKVQNPSAAWLLQQLDATTAAS
jgi:hypothetical protein